MAHPIEMRRTPHQGSLSNPSTADPTLAGEKGDREGDKGKAEKEMKGGFETKRQHVLPEQIFESYHKSGTELDHPECQ